MKNKSYDTVEVQAICLECGHHNDKDINETNLWNQTNLRYCNICKSKNIYVERN